VLSCVQATADNRFPAIEHLNRSYRREVFDAYVFGSINEVRGEIAHWLATYNTERPHDSLGRVPPLTLLPRHIIGLV
jgi:putative transposase